MAVWRPITPALRSTYRAIISAPFPDYSREMYVYVPKYDDMEGIIFWGHYAFWVS